MQKQREFVADASHELRTPLTSVLANLELLQASLGGSRPGRRPRDRRLGPALLETDGPPGRRPAAARPRRRRASGRARRVDLAEIAGEAAAEAAPLMGERALVVENERPLRVEGSRDELHRMVLNLLDNAIRHTPPAPASNSACARSAARRSSKSATTAPGSRRRCATQIFDRFVRGTGPADTARGTGTGLGLAIVGAVAESHGGSVEAGESKSGGALFTARIPLVSRPRKRSRNL